MRELAYDWLDHILKGKPKPELLKDKVNYQVMGTNEWRHSPDLQSLSNDKLRLYLDNKTLTSIQPKKKRYEVQTVNFKDREDQNNYFTPEIVFDTLDASNGLIFQSKPYESAFIINGSFTG